MIYLIYINGTMLSNCNYNNIHLTVLSRLVTITSFFESCIFTNESIFSLFLGEFSAFLGFLFCKEGKKKKLEIFGLIAFNFHLD